MEKLDDKNSVYLLMRLVERFSKQVAEQAHRYHKFGGLTHSDAILKAIEDAKRQVGWN